MVKKPNGQYEIKVFEVCLKLVNPNTDSDEVECLLSTLIYQGYMKGYIAHNQQKVVVSTSNSFPKIENQHEK